MFITANRFGVHAAGSTVSREVLGGSIDMRH